MEIPAWCFFSLWALISISFLHLGFHALDKTDLSNSVSPVVMSLFKHSLAIFCCHSSSYALIFRPLPRLPTEERYLWVIWGSVAILLYRTATVDTVLFVCLLRPVIFKFLAWLPGYRTESMLLDFDRFLPIMFVTVFYGEFFPLVYCFPVFTLINFIFIFNLGNDLTREQKAGIGVHMVVESSLFLFSTKFSPMLVLVLSFFTSAFWASVSGLYTFTCVSSRPFESPRELLAVAANKVKGIYSNLKEKKTAKLIEFAGGAVGTILFQYFFKLTTFIQVAAFFYLAVAWMANLALLGVSCDLGVFNFLLLNVIMGCTESQFGLQGATWLAFGASLLLFGLRLKLQSLAFVNREDQTRVVLW